MIAKNSFLQDGIDSVDDNPQNYVLPSSVDNNIVHQEAHDEFIDHTLNRQAIEPDVVNSQATEPVSEVVNRRAIEPDHVRKSTRTRSQPAYLKVYETSLPKSLSTEANMSV